MAADRLTAKRIEALKPREKSYKATDGRGLFLLVRPDGALWWRFKYRFGGREKLLSMGTYPDTSLKLARENRDEARKQLAAGNDPSAIRRAEKVALSDTFKHVALEWLAKQNVTSSTRGQLRRRLETYVFGDIGRYPVRQVTIQDMRRILNRIEERGTHETAHRVRSLCSRVFRYSVASGRSDADPAAALIGTLAKTNTTHFPALTDKKSVGALLRAIDGYQGSAAVTAALRLAPLMFVRPGELRGADWSEFDLDAGEWLIPGARMKMSRDHIVPLSDQAVAILRELYRLTGTGDLVFPSLRSKSRPISENSLNAALRNLGYSKNQQTTHGFRTIASTLLHELNYPSEVIELQLAHADANKIRSAYNRAERLEERRRMMQQWADYLGALKTDTGATVTALHG